jgi:hypothetical protein
LAQRLKQYGFVDLNKKFLVSTSGRRYRKGVVSAMYNYIPNGASRAIFKKQLFNNFTPIRNEAISPAIVIMPIVVILASLLIFSHRIVAAKANQFEDFSEKKYAIGKQHISSYLVDKKNRFKAVLVSRSVHAK